MTSSMLNGYVAHYNREKFETFASTQYEAKCNAVDYFQAKAGRRKVKSHMVSVTLVKRAGESVQHNADF